MTAAMLSIPAFRYFRDVISWLWCLYLGHQAPVLSSYRNDLLFTSYSVHETVKDLLSTRGLQEASSRMVRRIQSRLHRRLVTTYESMSAI